MDRFEDLKNIEPIKIKKNISLVQLVDNVYSNMGYNAKRLAESCEIYNRMIEQDAVVALTLAGAMTPIGMHGAIIQMMECGFIDLIISTGANLYHSMHRAFDQPVKQGHFLMNDAQLNQEGVARIYDVLIKDDETLLENDRSILAALDKSKIEKKISTADFHYLLGKFTEQAAKYPEKSLLTKAAEYDVPIYCPSPADSSIGMNLAIRLLKDTPVPIEPHLDIIESTAIVGYSKKKNGVIICGGGSPKNFYLQTQPMLWQMLKDDKGGHDYFIQITDARPDTGGLSGATPQEAISWGKMKNDRDSTVVYVDASVALPILFGYVYTKQKPKKLKRLYKEKENLVAKLKKSYRSKE